VLQPDPFLLLSSSLHANEVRDMSLASQVRIVAREGCQAIEDARDADTAAAVLRLLHQLFLLPQLTEHRVRNQEYLANHLAGLPDPLCSDLEQLALQCRILEADGNADAAVMARVFFWDSFIPVSDVLLSGKSFWSCGQSLKTC